MSPIQNGLLALLIFSVGPAHSQLDARSCEENRVKGTLFSVAPEFSGATQFLDELVLKPDTNRTCIKTIENSPALMAFVEEGRRAQARYLGLHQTHFGSLDQNLVLTPDLEIMRRLKIEMSTPPSRRRGPVEKTPPEWKIQQNALVATVTRFGLPQSTTLPGLMARRNRTGEFVYEQALDFYRRTEARLRLTMQSPEMRPPPPSPDRFKAQMIERLYGLRVFNFQAAVRESLPDWKSHTISIKDRATGQAHKIPIEELGAMKVQILPIETGQGSDSEVQGYLPKDRRGWILDSYLSFKDNVRSYYSTASAREAMDNSETVQLRDTTGAVFFISILDFKRLLATLNPKAEDEHFGNDPLLHRFRLESVARDIQLANMIGFLKSTRDRTFDDLRKRLQSRLDQRGFDQNNATEFLTYEINIAADRAIRPETPAYVLWYGWAKNPQHWRVRATEATSIGVPYFNADISQVSDINKTKIAKSINKETNRVSLRYESESQRAAKTKKIAATRTGKVAAGLTALWIATQTDLSTLYDFFTLQVPPIMAGLSGGGSGSGRPMWDFPGFIKLMVPGAGGGRDTQSMDSSIEADNYEINNGSQAGDGKGGPKGLGDAHDPASSPYAIEVIFKKSSMPTPRYYNFANNAHIPENIRDYTGDDDYKGSIREIQNDDSWSPDLALDVNNRNLSSKANRIALVEIKDYQLAGAELYDWKNSLVPRNAYRIYWSTENKQVYAKLRDKSHNGPFTYRLYYRFKPEAYKEGYLAEGISRDSVSRVDGRLKQSGFVDLSKQIESIAPDTKGHIDFNWIASGFVASSSYTFKSKTWKINPNADSAFKPYTIFLNDGHLYYQCTGSNLLYQTYVNEAAKDQGSETQVKALPLVGWMASEDKGVKRGTPGHLHSLIVGQPRSYEDQYTFYLETDATPPGEPTSVEDLQRKQENAAEHEEPKPAPESRPSDGKRKSEDSKQSQQAASAPEEKDQSGEFKIPPPGEEWYNPPPFIVPTAPKIVGEPVEERNTNVNNEPRAQVPKFAPRSTAAIDKILERIRKMNNLAWQAIYPIAEENRWLRRFPQLSDLPGIRLVILTNSLLKAFEELRSPELALVHLQTPRVTRPIPSLTAEQAIPELNAFFVGELDSYRKAIEFVESRIATDQHDQMDFLIYDPIRSRLRELAETLSLYAWGELLDEYRGAKLGPFTTDGVGCEDTLSTGTPVIQN